MRQSAAAMKLLIPLVFAFVTALAAQEAPKKDPFIKDKKAATPPPTEQVANVTFLLESFTMPQADYIAWLKVPGNRDGLHGLLLEAMRAGKATLDACHYVSTKSGTRFSLESVDEMSFPVEWDHADEKGFQYPVAFEMKPAGDRLEAEPTVDASNSLVDVNQSFERVRFAGLRAQKADRTLPGVVVADFHEQRAPANAALPARMPALVSVHAASEGQVSLTFITPRVQPVIRPAKAAPRGAGNILLTPRVISLDRLRAWELMEQHADDARALLHQLNGSLADGSAVLEHISMLRGKPGMRVQSEAVKQHYYGTEFHPPTPAKPPAQAATQAGTSNFDCRRIGFNWEAESVLSTDGQIIDINIMFERCTFAGNLADPLWNEHYPDYPVFGCQKITTSCAQAAGSTILLSTLNPPGDTGVNGRKDESRVWFLFLEAVVE
ncbi:MAG: hypothetical protein U1F81_10820 [Verrucomicrobiaceae bacterium]